MSVIIEQMETSVFEAATSIRDEVKLKDPKPYRVYIERKVNYDKRTYSWIAYRYRIRNSTMLSKHDTLISKDGFFLFNILCKL